MTKHIIAIIGTDTEIGKTYICQQLLEHFIGKNKNVTGLKPIATGVITNSNGKINSDSYIHYQTSNCKLSPEETTPFLFNEPIAPHIAAKMEGKQLTLKQIKKQLDLTVANSQADVIIIEGIGGLMTPLNHQETYLDLLISLRLPVILVVGIKLGCLNHALLTHRVLKNSDLQIAGFIANQIEPEMAYIHENIQTLMQMLSCPLLAINNYQQKLKLTNAFSRLFHE